MLLMHHSDYLILKDFTKVDMQSPSIWYLKSLRWTWKRLILCLYMGTHLCLNAQVLVTTLLPESTLDNLKEHFSGLFWLVHINMKLHLSAS